MKIMNNKSTFNDFIVVSFQINLKLTSLRTNEMSKRKARNSQFDELRELG